MRVHVFACPSCGASFKVPADAAGADIGCLYCPWSGLCAYVDPISVFPLPGGGTTRRSGEMLAS